MKILVAYNLQKDKNEENAEFLSKEDVLRVEKAIKELGYKTSLVEVSGEVDEVIEKIKLSEPDLIFNLAEGSVGESREAFYPSLFKNLGIPYTGSNCSLLFLNLDKHLTKEVLKSHDIKVPKGFFVKNNDSVKNNLNYPVIIKPNFEGSSKGITQDSIALNFEECCEKVSELLKKYPAGVIVEEYIEGREITVPMLEYFPELALDIVENTFDIEKINYKYNIYDYTIKRGEYNNCVKSSIPTDLPKDVEEKIIEDCKRIFKLMNYNDFARADIRLSKDNIPYFIEMNPLPSLHPKASLMLGAKNVGLEYKDVINNIIHSAIKRTNLKAIIRNSKKQEKLKNKQNKTLREEGIITGYYKTGEFNAITDVKGVMVGHSTHMNDVVIPETGEKTKIRSGVTAIIPAKDVYETRLMAGGFVLNGIGEMAGMTQVLEWEWLETPIMLTNTMSVGRVHDGLIEYMLEKYPKLHGDRSVIIPVVGEANDSFLNDTRIRSITITDVKKAINSAKVGAVLQGSVGAGTGMTSFDFAGGIGTSSRCLPKNDGGYTVGVLVLSNFGIMRNLTINGKVVGTDLDEICPKETRRTKCDGSIIVVVATDAPMLSSQLNRLSRRAALGLARVGSHARTTSGEIIISFSTGNHISRYEHSRKKITSLEMVGDSLTNKLYEATVEATEEAVLNAMFCSEGMDGWNNHYSPYIPHEKILELLKN
ncbi:D-alanine--D-alanine ligase [Methanococcoides vulcani]|uniref:D-alanine--D-alanine ligase n=1 Tax=Methanococcoides vulcani TaxID=1353158 RepID=A0A1H9ZW76_9EURY|nr:P1 family peptidase [Methanococcoides vulcani]SES86018.1 D-alanine--D-alanine ligase [Methanococcoides vulcani]